MRPNYLNCCNLNISNHAYRTTFSMNSCSIFNNLCFNNYGCNFGSSKNSFWKCFGFGFGLGFGQQLVNMFGNFGNMFGNFGNMFGGFNFWNSFNMWGNFNMNRPQNNNNCTYTKNNYVQEDNITVKTKNVKTKKEKTIKEKTIKEKTKKVKNEPDKKTKKNYEIENSCPDETIAKEIDSIAQVVMKKYLKTGQFKLQDLPIERVDAKITSVDISGEYNLKSGTDNDYRDKNGNTVRVADGTIITLEYNHEGKEYTCKIKSDKIPKKGKPKSYIEKAPNLNS